MDEQTIVWCQEYREHPDSPITKIGVASGVVIVDMVFDSPFCKVRGHAHTFDHDFQVLAGDLLVHAGSVVRTLRAGSSMVVPAHIQHDIVPLTSTAHGRCTHYHADIDPAKITNGAIPLEWLRRLTDEVLA